MAPTNRAAWLRKVNERLDIAPAEIGKPGRGEVLLKNHAVAMNPVDWLMQDGLFPPGSLPRVLGNDLAGEIVEVGDDVGNYKKGQRVLAHATALASERAERGPFQEFTVVPTTGIAIIPETMRYEDACVLPLAISTAAMGLFHGNHLALPGPKHKVEECGKALLVWGGSSSVGSAAIQLAVAAGLKVITTTSKRNFDMCKDLGASEVFDRTSPGIVGDLTAALQKYALAGAFDAISTRDTQLNVAQVVAQLGGGKVALVLPPVDELPATMNATSVFAVSILGKDSSIAALIYRDFLPDALKSGQLKPAPKPDIVGHGLEYIQPALDKLRAGVSGSKIVVTL